jgi:acetyltransferase
VIVVTNSGGPAVLTADLAEELGLNVAEPSPQAIDSLREFLPAHCAFRNPIDLTVEGNEEGYRRTLMTVLDEYDAAIALDICPPYLDPTGHARGVVAAAQATGKPVVANFLPNQVTGNSLKVLKEAGIPNYPSGERAAAVLSEMARYSAAQRARAARTSAVGKPMSLQERVERLQTETGHLPNTGPILEPDAMAWLAENGIPVPALRFAQDMDTALKGCEEIGYPVVMKVVSPQILHKSDVGGVVVGIPDPTAARTAFEKIQKAAEGLDFRGVVIYPLVRGAQEVLLGLYRDAQFGPVVVFGLGGIYTEIWKDISLRIAPVDRMEALEMIHEIRAIKLLQGARGAPACDLEALADVLVRFSELPFRYPDIAEMDLNPVFIKSDGLSVGDVRIIRQDK